MATAPTNTSMPVREKLRQYPKTIAVVIGVILLAMVYLRWSNGVVGHDAGGSGTRLYFSTDDGKTWFADDANKLPPFQKSGKEAVRAYVYKGSDGKEFVSHLERYTPDAKSKLEAAYASHSRDPMLLQRIQTTGVEVKAPSQPNWVKVSDPKAAAIIVPRCPDGSEPEPVLP